jgi:hypothetical protein
LMEFFRNCWLRLEILWYYVARFEAVLPNFNEFSTSYSILRLSWFKFRWKVPISIYSV